MDHNINCGVVHDLLPLYAEGVASDDSRLLIEAHLPGCQACRAELEALQNAAASAAPKPDASLRRVRRKLKKRLVITLASVAAGLSLLFGIFVFGSVYTPPMRYEEGMIQVGPFDWNTGQFTESGGIYSVVSKYYKVIDCTREVLHTNADGSIQTWIFVHYKKDALWDRLFLDRGDFAEDDWKTGLQLNYGEFEDADRVHATVYWINDPDSLDRMQVVARETDHLSEEVLAMCTLIWDGDIK